MSGERFYSYFDLEQTPRQAHLDKTPQHITLTPSVPLVSPEVLNEYTEEAYRRSRIIGCLSVTLAEQILMGPRKNIPALAVKDHSDKLQSLHETLMEALRETIPDEKMVPSMYTGSNYVPHSTIKGIRNPIKGFQRLESITILKSDGQRKTIHDVIPLRG